MRLVDSNNDECGAVDDRDDNNDVMANDDKNIIRIDCVKVNEKENKSCYNYEDALELAGNGKYNITLLLILSLVLVAMAIDMFSFSLVVAGSDCDFRLTLAEKGILNSMPFIGVLIMAYPWGYISDTQGRKKTLMWAMCVSFVTAVLSSFSPNWKVLAALKLITSSFSSAAQSSSYVLLGECCVSRVRNVYMLLMSTALMLAHSVFYLVGYGILSLDFSYNLGFLNLRYTPWRLLTLVYALPLGLSALGLLLCYESPKFLANQDRMTEAVSIFTKIFIKNNGSLKSFPVKQLVLDEEGNTKNTDNSILKSIWQQTAPLFKPPLLWRTLQLYFLQGVVYSTTNSFVIWFPFLVDAFFSSYNTPQLEGSGLCHFIVPSLSSSTAVSNVTGDAIEATLAECSSSLALQTVISGVIYSLFYGALIAIISRFSNRKKTVLLIAFTASAVAGVGLNLSPQPLLSLVLFIIFMVTAMGMGILPVYFVDLYPTSHRGMVACLGVMVARLSALAGINLVGAIIVDNCTTTFYSWSAFVLIGVLVTCFLPSDKRPKKTI